MRKELIHIVFLATLLVSCEEYYKPKLETVPGLLVVESHVTNDPNQNFVKLSVTNDFFNTNPKDNLTGTGVELLEIGSVIIPAIEKSPGYFTFTKTPVPGNKYKLRISYQKDTYESDTLQMPPIPKIDSLYTNHKVEKAIRNDAYGGITQINVPSREIYIDAPITPSLQYYRFNWRAILQWNLTPPSEGGIPPPSIYGWLSLYDNDLFNLAGPKQYSVSGQVQKHPILSLAYNNQVYLLSREQSGSGWIVIIDQYGISKASYDFHVNLNKQLSAEGSLFEPVLPQVYGNIHCISDDSKIALGFFDLNSYRQYRYFLFFGYDEKTKVIQRRLNRYPDIPGNGELQGIIPEFWENAY
jgi:hypothetical protein